MWSYETAAVAIRFVELSDTVDSHVAVQGTVTFRGATRTPSTPPVSTRPLIEHVTTPTGDDPWSREKTQRDAIAEFTAQASPDALIIVSDGDEIPHPDAIRRAVAEYDSVGPRTLPVDYREWFANWRAPDAWQYPHAHCHMPTVGTAADYATVGGACEARWGMYWPHCEPRGWHLSNLGDARYVHDKFGQFAHSEVDNPHDRNTNRLQTFRDRRRDCIDRFDLETTADLPATIDRFPGCIA